jgi:acetylornithine deacetylase/succinyl-diaminopimelate desuccinylase-like protein
MAREPYEIAADAPLVREAEEAYRAAYGRPPRLSATAGFEDAGLLARTGMAVIMFGPYYTRDEDDGTLSGSSSEYVVLDELVVGTRILTDLAIRMLR